MVTVAPTIGLPVPVSLTVPVIVAFEAATYGPTNGPPSPTGAAPAGFTEAVEVSVAARPTFSRPLPVCAAVPATSADSARRFTTTPAEADGSIARSRPAAPATWAAD